ncbi:MAG: bbsG 6, partial [Frankiales bacterium]|nr:bbsG 6 [Frankiales bacterium]
MTWDFSVEPEFQELLDWAETFVTQKCYKLDLLWRHDTYKPLTDQQRAIVDPMKQEVRDHKLWACHLGPELGGQGYGQLKLAMLNEILGKSTWAPRIFGTQAPDTGNAEIIAHYGTPEQKEAYLKPLLEGEIVSCFSMTEPQGGADPGVFTCAATRDGDEWVINGEKFFSSNARWATFFIVMAVTNPDAPVNKRMSMFLVPADTPGINIVRNLGTIGEPEGEGTHGYIRYEEVRVPTTAMLGAQGDAFGVAQTRLGGGRVHHAMRSVG